MRYSAKISRLLSRKKGCLKSANENPLIELVLLKAFQSFQCFRRFGSDSVVRIEVGCANDAVGTDNQAGRNGKFPICVFIVLVQVDSELSVNVFQIVWKSVLQTKLVSIGVVSVMEDFEIKLPFINQFAIV